MTQGSALYTGPTVEDLDRIPADLKARPQWVLWRGEDRVDPQTGKVKLNKILIDPHTLHNADTTAPLTWGPFDQCVAALPVALEEWEQDDPSAYCGGGIGFVFASDDPYAGIDLDHCRDPDTGAITDWAQAHIDALASYTEVTPSGTGLHTIAQGALPPKGRKKGAVEMYSYARFFTMTGWRLADAPHTITAHQEALYEVHGRVFGPQTITLSDGAIVCYCPSCDYLATLMPNGACPSCSTPPLGAPTVMTGPTPSPTPMLEDTVLLDKARAAKNGTKFTVLWSGDITEYDSPSNADMALCVRLTFWTQDAVQIDRLFRQSGLMRTKWDEQRGAQTYGERTIMEALARQSEHYIPHNGAELLITIAVQHAQQGQNGHTPGTQDPSATDEAKKLFERIKTAPEEDHIKIVYEGIDAILAQLSTAEWAIWVDRAKALLGKRLDRNKLEKARNETIIRQRETAAQNAALSARQQDPRPDIKVLSDIAPPVDALQMALLACPQTPLYQRGRFLCHIGAGGPKLKWLQRPPDMPQILLTSTAHLRELASRAARFWVDKGKSLRTSRTPSHKPLNLLTALFMGHIDLKNN
jgi:putative DNA primase/helicase